MGEGWGEGGINNERNLKAPLPNPLQKERELQYRMHRRHKIKSHFLSQ